MKKLGLHRTILLLVLLFTGMYAYGENAKKVKVQGKYELSRHITIEQAEQKALEDAKVNALRKAGVSEKLWTVTGLISEDDGSDFSQVLSRISTLEMNGFVSVRKQSDFQTELVDGKTYITVTIEADVKSGNDRTDPTFVLDINGLKGIYTEGEKCRFDITVYGQDAYVKLFWFDSKSGSLIYPNEYEPAELLKKETAYSFPMSRQIDYVMERSDKSKEFESINLIAVATKKNIPCLLDEITFESVLKWIYAIPSDQRAAQRESIVIR